VLSSVRRVLCCIWSLVFSLLQNSVKVSERSRTVTVVGSDQKWQKCEIPIGQAKSA